MDTHINKKERNSIIRKLFLELKTLPNMKSFLFAIVSLQEVMSYENWEEMTREELIEIYQEEITDLENDNPIPYSLALNFLSINSYVGKFIYIVKYSQHLQDDIRNLIMDILDDHGKYCKILEN